MKKRLICTLAVMILLTSLLSGCGGAKHNASASAGSAATDVMRNSESDMAFSEATGQLANGTAKNNADTDALGITGSGSTESVSNAVLAERKVVRKANVTVEVDSFDEAYGKINTIITGIGYIQESNISADKVYVDSAEKLIKHGVIIIRVDKAKFDGTFGSIKGIGTVLNENMGIEDVSDKFYDTESSLRLLKYEQSRLEAYLQKLDDPDKIFKAESRLTEIRHQIESLTVNLNKLSNLVELATITVNLNEKTPGSLVQVKKIGYGDKLLDRFMGSIKGVVNFCGEFLILIVQLIPVLLLLGVFLLIGIVIYRKVSKLTGKDKGRNKDGGTPPAPPEN